MGPYAGLTFEISPQLNSRMVVFYGAFEREVTSLLARVLRPGMVVFDVGAHIGIHALYIAKLLKHGLVYAFEPCPENFLILEKNVRHNRGVIAKVIPLRRAVGASSGVARFALGPTDGTHHLAAVNDDATLQVQITTLDDFCLDTQQRPDLILVDIEGEEMSLLKGATRLITECKPKLILEHHGPDRQAQISSYLKSLGYRVEASGSRHIYAEHRSR